MDADVLQSLALVLYGIASTCIGVSNLTKGERIDKLEKQVKELEGSVGPRKR
jgi:hypothetical protein